MAALFPVVDVPEFLEAENDYDMTYRPSVAWDIEKGDFIMDGRKRMVMCDGFEAYKIWCYKAVQTERFRCLSYRSEIGVEMEDAMKEKTDDAVESAVERTITEALLSNPRTESVGNFSFMWNGDVLRCSFYVRGVEWDKFPLEITIGGDNSGY